MPPPAITPEDIPRDKTDRPEKDREQKDENTAAHDAVVLAYHLVLKGGKEQVVEMKSELVLPLALAVENMPQTDISFPELFDQVIVRPLVTKFRAFLQRRFDEASAVEAKKTAEAEPPAEPPPRRPVIDPTRLDKEMLAKAMQPKPKQAADGPAA